MEKFTQEKIAKIDEAIDRLLAQRPPERINSKSRLVAANAEKIRAILKKGWPIDAVLDAFAENGVQMTERTLRSYLQRSLKKPKAGLDISVWLDYPEEKEGDRPSVKTGA